MIATEAHFVVSATEVAVRLTIKVTPGAPGAVYVIGTPLALAAGETDPHVSPLQVMLQVTPFPAGSFFTVAVNCVVASGGTVNDASETETLTAGGGGNTMGEPPPPQPAAMTSKSTPVKRVKAKALGPANPLRAILRFISPGGRGVSGAQCYPPHGRSQVSTSCFVGPIRTR